jgi:hypothetical protein
MRAILIREEKYLPYKASPQQLILDSPALHDANEI